MSPALSLILVSTLLTLFSDTALATFHRYGGHKAPAPSFIPFPAGGHPNVEQSNTVAGSFSTRSATASASSQSNPGALYSSGYDNAPMPSLTSSTVEAVTSPMSCTVQPRNTSHISPAGSLTTASLTWPIGWVSPVLVTISGTAFYPTTGNGDSPAPFPTSLASFGPVPASLTIPANSINGTRGVESQTLSAPYSFSNSTSSVPTEGHTTAIGLPTDAGSSSVFLASTSTSLPGYVVPSVAPSDEPPPGFDDELRSSSSYPTPSQSYATEAPSSLQDQNQTPLPTSSLSVVETVAISSAISRITNLEGYGALSAYNSALIPTSIHADISSATAQITSLAGVAGSSISGSARSSDASDHYMPPESILAGISSAVAQITSLLNASDATEREGMPTAAPPPGTTILTSTAVPLGYDGSPASATYATGMGYSMAPSVYGGYSAFPSTFTTLTVSASAQASGPATSSDVSKTSYSGGDRSDWFSGILDWPAKTLDNVFHTAKRED